MEGKRDVEMCIKPLPRMDAPSVKCNIPLLPLSQFTPASVFEYYNRFSRFPLQLKQKYDWTVKLDGKVCLSSILNCHADISHFRSGPPSQSDRGLLIISSPSIELNPTHAR